MALSNVVLIKPFSGIFPSVKIVSRGLQLISRLDTKPCNPPPFDFMNTAYPPWLMFDNTTRRFTENTKFISVEGNVASGKGQVSRKIAEHFGMNYIPDPTDEDIYVFKNYNPRVDVRMHNSMLPKEAQYYTTEMFWTEDNLKENGKPIYLQYQYYIRRYWNYLIGLSTLFNTGKGCVSNRCHFSDVVFVEALHKCGLISDYGYDWFNYLHASTALNLWKPHLLVYVKASNEQIFDAIKKRGLEWEINSKTLNDDFLSAYAKAMEIYLDKMFRYCHVFVVDRSSTDIYNENELTILMEKLTHFDYEGERLIRDDYKYLEWRNGLFNERSATYNRGKFSSATLKFSTVFKRFPFPRDLTEAMYTFEAKELQHHVYKRDPRLKYRPGYNPSSDSLLQMMFNPKLQKKNFAKDWPKEFLTYY